MPRLDKLVAEGTAKSDQGSAHNKIRGHLTRAVLVRHALHVESVLFVIAVIVENHQIQQGHLSRLLGTVLQVQSAMLCRPICLFAVWSQGSLVGLFPHLGFCRPHKELHQAFRSIFSGLGLKPQMSTHPP